MSTGFGVAHQQSMQSDRCSMALVRLDGAAINIRDLLENCQLTAERRQQLEQAANAIKLAEQCVRNGGPGKAVSVGPNIPS